MKILKNSAFIGDREIICSKWMKAGTDFFTTLIFLITTKTTTMFQPVLSTKLYKN